MPPGFESEQIRTMLAIAGGIVLIVSPIVKSTIDVIRMFATLEPWVYPVLALGELFGVALLIYVAASIPLSVPTIAICLLSAVLGLKATVGDVHLAERGNAAVQAVRARRGRPD